MTLRKSLGGEVQRIYEQIDALLDSAVGLLVLFDGGRMVTYAQGFGASPCQLELLGVEREWSVRNIVGERESRSERSDKTNDEKGNEGNRHRRGATLRQHLGRHGGEDHSSVVDGRSVRSADAAEGGSGVTAGRVLRLATTA